MEDILKFRVQKLRENGLSEQQISQTYKYLLKICADPVR